MITDYVSYFVRCLLAGKIVHIKLPTGEIVSNEDCLGNLISFRFYYKGDKRWGLFPGLLLL